jgi:hypothetical protein
MQGVSRINSLIRPSGPNSLPSRSNSSCRLTAKNTIPDLSQLRSPLIYQRSAVEESRPTFSITIMSNPMDVNASVIRRKILGKYQSHKALSRPAIANNAADRFSKSGSSELINHYSGVRVSSQKQCNAMLGRYQGLPSNVSKTNKLDRKLRLEPLKVTDAVIKITNINLWPNNDGNREDGIESSNLRK